MPAWRYKFVSWVERKGKPSDFSTFGIILPVGGVRYPKMHPVVIVLLILLLIQLVLIRRWMDQVERGIVSFFKYNVVLFLFSIMLLILQWRSGSSPIALMCYGVLAGTVFISIMNLKTNDSEKSRDDLRIWSGHTILLTFGTGALALMIHDSDSIGEVVSLLGFVAVVFYSMFLRSPR